MEQLVNFLKKFKASLLEEQGARLYLQINQPKEINRISPQIQQKSYAQEVPRGKILPTLGGRAFCYTTPKL